MAKLEIVHQRIITRVDTLQSSIDALAANFDEQFRWIRQKLDPRGEASSSDPPVADLKQEVFSSAPVLNHEHKEFEIEAEWDHKVVEFEVDLVQKVTIIGTIKELLEKGFIGSPPPTAKVQERSANSDLKGTMSNYISTQFNCKNPNLGFPKLNGENVNGWVMKRNLFSKLNKFTEEPKNFYVALQLDRIDAAWLPIKFKTLGYLIWPQFEDALMDRFSQPAYENVPTSPNKPQPIVSVIASQNEFKIFLYLVLEGYAKLPGSYFISGLGGDLKKEIKGVVRLFNPQTLSHAIQVARLQEEIIAIADDQAEQIGCTKKPTNGMFVIIIDGIKTYNAAKCSIIQWEMVREQYEPEMRLLFVGGCDTSLAMQNYSIPDRRWLKATGHAGAVLLERSR
ncbi:hypothetical protein LguiB_024199 [Lonicera macranthoides]